MNRRCDWKGGPHGRLRGPCCMLLGMLLFVLACRDLRAAGRDSWRPLADFEGELGNRRNEVSALRDKVVGKKGMISYEMAEDAWRKGRQSEDAKRYNDAWELYGLAIKWYRDVLSADLKEPAADSYSKDFLACLERMKGRLRGWERIKGEISACLSDETMEKWFPELDRETQEQTPMEERRRISVIWMLSLYSMIDYSDLAICMSEKNINNENFMDAFNEFSKVVADNINCLRWKNSFENYLKEWEEIMKSHYLDQKIKTELKDFMRKRMEFLKNMSTYYLVRDPSPEFEEWINAQLSKYESIMNEND